MISMGEMVGVDRGECQLDRFCHHLTFRALIWSKIAIKRTSQNHQHYISVINNMVLVGMGVEVERVGMGGRGVG